MKTASATLRRDLLLLFVLALLFNFGAALFVTQPGYVDDAYYFGGALRLASGEGFTEPYLWNYLGNPASLPVPSHLYWMPLTSIVAAFSMTIFGPSFAAARLPFLLLASLLPLVACYVARITTGRRRHAGAAGLLAIFCGYYVIYWGTTDSFALYAVIVSLTFNAASRGSEVRSNDFSRSGKQTAEAITTNNGWRWWLVAGVGAGLAHLTRADGVLVLAAVLLVVLISPRHRVTLSPLLLAFGYLLVMLPWFIRNTLATGSPLGAGGAGTLWLTEYNDIFNYPSNLTPARYFAAGWGAILDGKWQSLITNLQTIIAVQGLIFLAPFILIGLWQLRKYALYQIVIWYALLLYAAMTFAFSFPGMRGGLLHSGAALLSFYFPAALAGLDRSVDWVASRLKHWQAEKAKRNFTALLVVFAVVLTLALVSPRASGSKRYPMFAILAGLPKEAVVMSNNPPGVWVATGHPGVPVPNGDGNTIIAIVDQFHVKYLLLDKNITPGLVPLYESNGPEWLKLIEQVGDAKLFEVMR